CPCARARAGRAPRSWTSESGRAAARSSERDSGAKSSRVYGCGTMGFVSRGFKGRRRDEGPEGRVPPGQYLTDDFPVLPAAPAPETPPDGRTFTIEGGAEPVSWTWDEFQALPSEDVTVD